LGATLREAPVLLSGQKRQIPVYSIIVIDDEPEAVENIYDIVKIYCPRFTVVASGEDGIAGLELCRQHQPDLVLTDIKMPKMDGLELITRLHLEMPLVKSIIISGYQDFEYARTALRFGAADYLLKPISPATLKTRLEEMVPLIENTKAEKRLSLIQRLLNNDTPAPQELKAYFAAPSYTVALSRKNGLPSRFSPNIHAYAACTAGGEVLDFYGRDEMESIHLAPDKSLLSQKGFEEIKWLHKDISGYTTTIIWKESFPIEELPELIKSLYNTMNRAITIGKTQIIAIGPKSGETKKFNSEPKPPLFNAEKKQALEHYVRENKSQELKTLLLEILERAAKEGFTQIQLEDQVRIFLEQIRVGLENVSCDERIEFMIEDAFFYAINYDDLKESLLYILGKILPNFYGAVSKIDTPEFFELIRNYTHSRFAEALSLQALCRHFGISQTYLSRLFRKYTGQSFVNYLTAVRIEKAKRYLSQKDILVRDAAAMSGFKDPLYFTRVFHALTGLTPSEYMANTE
jgi:two-component system response regulator YesN